MDTMSIITKPSGRLLVAMAAAVICLLILLGAAGGLSVQAQQEETDVAVGPMSSWQSDRSIGAAYQEIGITGSVEKLAFTPAYTVFAPIVFKGSGTTPPTPDPIEDQTVVLINAERTSRGIPALTKSTVVWQVAKAHSQDMLDRQFFSHVNPDGKDPGDRLHDAGYNYSYAGENIAAGYPTAQDVVAAWMASPGHRANILNPNFTEIGLGYVYGASDPSLYRHYWTALFATPQ